MTLLTILSIISATAFGLYGYETLIALAPKGEFERYGMTHLREVVGVLQLFGAAGVVVGLRVGPIGALSALGLMAMMIMALIVRVRIQDSIPRMVPAGALAALNGALCAVHVAQLV